MLEHGGRLHPHREALREELGIGGKGRIDYRLRHAVIDEVEKTDLATGLADLAGYLGLAVGTSFEEGAKVD